MYKLKKDKDSPRINRLKIYKINKPISRIDVVFFKLEKVHLIEEVKEFYEKLNL